MARRRLALMAGASGVSRTVTSYPKTGGGNYPRSTLSTGTRTRGSNVALGAATTPRCLFVPDDTSTLKPPNYRGEPLMLRLTCVDLNPESIDIFEMFEGEVV